MKKLIILLSFLPFLLSAQKFDFFENTKMIIEKTEINTINSDFGPGFVNNELWFSAFTDKEIVDLSKGKSKNIFYNLYSVKLDNNGNINGPKLTELDSISENYHAGPVSYCEKTKELFVTLSNFTDPDLKNKIYVKAKIRLKIIILKEIDNVWTITGSLPFNNSLYSVGHPSISETGDTLYFSSDIPGFGGFGETDIYMTIRTDGQWSDPINLGDKINSSNTEMFPFLYKGNMLLFASNNNKTNKDLDMLYSYLDDKWSEPKLIDELNTNYDDFNLIIHDNGNIGYFNSNSMEDSSDDIYKITFIHPEVKKPEPPIVVVPPKQKVPTKYVYENIFYDFDKWDILPESEVELNVIVKLMTDNPTWIVELGSHTDCRGSDSYNEILSQKRSDSAVHYIVTHGISQNRITAKGYGESQLVNHCDDGVPCSKAEHRKNRRTEIKVIEK